MSAMSLPPDPTPRQPKHGGIIGVIIPWAIAAAIIAAYAAYGPRTLIDAIVVLIVAYGFIGMGCAILCAWLIRRDTTTPFNDFQRQLNVIMTVFAQKHFDDGMAAGRASAPSLVVNRFGTSPTIWAQDDDAEESPGEQPGRTGTDPAP